jgi:hypothetical protein
LRRNQGILTQDYSMLNGQHFLFVCSWGFGGVN